MSCIQLSLKFLGKWSTKTLTATIWRGYWKGSESQYKYSEEGW